MADKASKLEQLRLLALKCAANTAEKILELTTTVEAALEERPPVTKAYGTFDGLGWVSSGNGYTQTITVDGVTADSDVIVIPAVAYKEAYEDMNCRLIGQAENSLTFKSDSPQDVAIEVGVIIYNFPEYYTVTYDFSEYGTPSALVLSNTQTKVKEKESFSTTLISIEDSGAVPKITVKMGENVLKDSEIFDVGDSISITEVTDNITIKFTESGSMVSPF